MIIDKSHVKLAAITAALALAATGAYLVSSFTSANGFDSGGVLGLLFGVAGSAMMVFAGLLSARKKAPRWQQLGTAHAWLKGHIWFGLLSGPLILLHAGFRFGGLLEQVLMLVFGIVYLSGVAGVVIQHFMPRAMTSLAPREGIFEQLDVTCERLRNHADRLVTADCGSLLAWASNADSKTTEPLSAADELKRFYCQNVRPFLEFDSPQDKRLTRAKGARRLFEEQLAAAPSRYHNLLEQLAAICDERRDMAVQRRLHLWLHGWLFLHVPLSLALLVLGATHAIVSLLYLY